MDAYQRALEIFLRRLDTVEPATEVAWLKVVVRNEALAIRRARSATVDGVEVDPDQAFASESRSVEEELAGDERVKRSAEALRALKPDEAKALILKAEGLSYAEIGERCGWSYTKTNRAITEGRRRFLEVFRAIESGDACERYAGTLAALAGGTATSEEILEIRPHLKHCMACRATVRELHVSKLRGLTLVIPAWLLAPVMSLGGLRDEMERLKPPEELLRDAPTIVVPDATPDHAASGAPHAIDLAGHLLATPERLEQFRRFPRLGRLRDEAVALVTRSNSSDVATGIYVASSSSGGGRVATIATVVGFCLSSLGAGAVCVATGALEAPGWIFQREPRAVPPAQTTGIHRDHAHRRDHHPPAPVSERPPPHTPASKLARQRAATNEGAPRSSSPPPRSSRHERAERAQASEFGFELNASPPDSGYATPPPTPAATTTPDTTKFDPARKEFGP